MCVVCADHVKFNVSTLHPYFTPSHAPSEDVAAAAAAARAAVTLAVSSTSRRLSRSLFIVSSSAAAKALKLAGLETLSVSPMSMTKRDGCVKLADAEPADPTQLSGSAG